jgi:hypothetical protein
METSEENQFQPKIVCNKGNVLLSEIRMPLSDASVFNLQFELNNLDTSKVNSDLLVTPQLYNLLEKVNVDLIEKIYILNTSTTLNNEETDICILIKNIAKEVGIKKKYILFRATKYLNKLNNSITYYNKDLIYEHKDLIDDYLKLLNLDNNNYEPLLFNFGKTIITLSNTNTNTNENIVNLKFSIDFQITMTDDIPNYMSNIIGLMFKKMFYNVKLFIENLNS